MEIKTIPVGELQANCYFLKQDQVGILIDPGDDAETIQKIVGLTPIIGILITHRHFDHIGALKACQTIYQAPVLEFHNLKEMPYQLGPFSFSPIFTKGHTSDSVTYYFHEAEVMFTGDFLFAGDIGRTDFPTGSMEEMNASIQKIKQYDAHITIFPGHEESTTLGKERQSNPYFR